MQFFFSEISQSVELFFFMLCLARVCSKFASLAVMNISWETALSRSNFSKLNKYVVSYFPKYPKELAHILDQWPAKFHLEIWWLFLLCEAQNVFGNKEILQWIGSYKLYFLRKQVFLLILMVLIIWIFMLADSQEHFAQVSVQSVLYCN